MNPISLPKGTIMYGNIADIADIAESKFDSMITKIKKTMKPLREDQRLIRDFPSTHVTLD